MFDSQDQGRILWGAALILVGIAVLLSNLGILPPILWEQWWPILLIVLGLMLIFRQWSPRYGRRERSIGMHPLEAPPSTESTQTRERLRVSPAGLILVGLGIAFLLRGNLGGAVVPAVILIAIGLAIILR